MNRITEVDLSGKRYALNYSVKAMVTLADKFGGDIAGISRAVAVDVGEERISAILAPAMVQNIALIASELSKYGALYRKRYDGAEVDTLTVEDIELLSPIEYLTLYYGVTTAIAKGGSRQIEAESTSKNAAATQDG